MEAWPDIYFRCLSSSEILTTFFLKTATKQDLEFEREEKRPSRMRWFIVRHKYTTKFLSKADVPAEEDGADMCESLERRSQRDKISGAIDILREDGKTNEDIIDRIMKRYEVTRDYVLELLTPAAV